MAAGIERMANMERIPWQMWMRIIHSGWAAVVKLECNVEIKTVHSLPHGMSMRGRDLDSRRLRICLIMDKRETSRNSGSAAGRNGEYRDDQIFPKLPAVKILSAAVAGVILTSMPQTQDVRLPERTAEVQDMCSTNPFPPVSPQPCFYNITIA